MWRPSFGSSGPQSNAGSDGCGLWPDDRSHERFAAGVLPGMSAYIPESYVDGYQYPLICHLHDDRGSHREIAKWFPFISDQNFLGLGVSAPFPQPWGLPGRNIWKERRPDASRGVLRDAIDAMSSEWSVHPDRIVLLGEGRGATVALQQFLLSQCETDDEPLRFQGVICRDLPACWPRRLPTLSEPLRGRILFLDPIRQCDAAAAIDGLDEAGLEISIAPEGEISHALQINHWMMSAISSAVW